MITIVTIRIARLIRHNEANDSGMNSSNMSTNVSILANQMLLYSQRSNANDCHHSSEEQQ